MLDYGGIGERAREHFPTGSLLERMTYWAIMEQLSCANRLSINNVFVYLLICFGQRLFLRGVGEDDTGSYNIYPKHRFNVPAPRSPSCLHLPAPRGPSCLHLPAPRGPSCLNILAPRHTCRFPEETSIAREYLIPHLHKHAHIANRYKAWTNEMMSYIFHKRAEGGKNVNRLSNICLQCPC